jgi:hypothetical protein
MSSKNSYRTPQGFKEVDCNRCNKEKVRIDGNSVSGTCYKCVSSGMNGESIIITDLPQEEYVQFIKRIFSYGRSENNSSEGTI